MTTYYVRPDGLDSHGGTGSSAANAWQTIGKALGATGISSGDTVYIAPGIYRETVSVAMTSAVAETKVLGDPSASQFSDLAGGEVIWTGYTTNDSTAPSASVLLSLSGRDYLTFRHLTMVAGSNTCIDASTQTSIHITIQDCAFYLQATGLQIQGAFGTTLSWVIERCLFWQRRNNTCINVATDTGSGTDYDVDVVIRNCRFLYVGTTCISFSPVGANPQKPGGLDIYNCSFLGATWAVATNTGTSTSIPCNFYNCWAVNTGVILAANAAGQLIENYNVFDTPSSNTNVSLGANSVQGNTRSPTLHIGEERLYGAASRMFLAPKSGSGFLSFGNDGTYTASEDLLGQPRPGGGGSATKGIGFLGRGDTFAKETGTVRTGTNAISITGPGTQDFDLPVDATAMTATVYVRWDATYAGTKPQMIVRNGEEAGVAAATATATGSSGNWEQLSLNFTPTRAGIVTIRLQSNDTNGGGKMFADDFNVS